MRAPDPSTDYRKAGLIALILAIVLIVTWEFYWRSAGKTPDLDDGKELWASQREKVDDLDREDVVIFGSSRVLFDIQLDQWEAVTGRRPVQLASAGTSPLPAFRDLVRESEFKGIAVVGVAPGLFFKTIDPGFYPWKRMENRVEYFHNKTLANRFNYWLSLPLDQNLAMASAGEESWDDNIDLKALVGRWKVGERTGKPFKPFYNFGAIDLDRNMRMTERTANDTAFANTVINAWGVEDKLKKMNEETKNMEDISEEDLSEEAGAEGEKELEKKGEGPDIAGVIDYFSEDVKRFRERGGKVILVRCPSNGAFRELESLSLPRDTAWDVLVELVQVPGIHFEDHPGLNQFHCPELSHLSAGDADIFTRELVNILVQKDLLKNPKAE